MNVEIMKMQKFYRYAFFLAGSVVIAISSGVGMTYVFKSNFALVYLSFIGIISGYKIAQIGYYNGKRSFKVVINDFRQLKNQKQSLVSFFGGSIFVSLGFILLGKAVIQTSIMIGLGSGAIIGVGYMLSHWAINNRLV